MLTCSDGSFGRSRRLRFLDPDNAERRPLSGRPFPTGPISTWSGPRMPSPLSADPESRLSQLGDHVVFDEAQHLPDLFRVLRSAIDRARSRHGRFVLLGSAAPSLVRGISESLAGRAAFLDLPPFRWDEVLHRKMEGLPASVVSRGIPRRVSQTRRPGEAGLAGVVYTRADRARPSRDRN